MPIPSPHKGETQDDFIARCHSALSNEFPDSSQRSAICFRQWREADMGLETRDFFNVELMTVGTWEGRGCPTGGCVFTSETLREIAEDTQTAFAEGLKSPVKLGHGEAQQILAEAGLPAAGWLENVRLNGSAIVSDIKQVPKRIADIMEAGGWRNRSVELRRRNGRLVLTGLALLGMKLPAIDTLKDIEALYAELDLGEPDETVLVFANKDDVDHSLEWLSAIVERHPTAKQQVESLRRAISGGHDMELTTIAARLGLASDVTEEQVLAKIDELNKPTKGEDEDKAEFTRLSTRVIELEKREALANAKALVDGAINDGRLLPAQREQSLKFALRDPEGFSEFVKTQPKLLNFGERGTSGTGESDEAEFEPTQLELDIARQTGVTREQIIVQKMEDAGRVPSTKLREAAFGKRE